MDQNQFMDMLKAAMADPTTRSIIANTLNESGPPSVVDKRESDEESVDSDGEYKSLTQYDAQGEKMLHHPGI